MARLNSESKFQSLSDLPEARIHCTSAQVDKISDIIELLPVKVPASSDIYIELTKDKVTIRSRNGLPSVELKPNSIYSSLTIDQVGVKISGVNLSTTTTVVVEREPADFPPGLTTLQSAKAPIDLLDEYASLKNKESLTAADEERLGSLLSEIGESYRTKQARQAKQKRSTPSTSGEGYSSFGSRIAG